MAPLCVVCHCDFAGIIDQNGGQRTNAAEIRFCIKCGAKQDAVSSAAATMATTLKPPRLPATTGLDSTLGIISATTASTTEEGAAATSTSSLTLSPSTKISHQQTFQALQQPRLHEDDYHSFLLQSTPKGPGSNTNHTTRKLDDASDDAFVDRRATSKENQCTFDDQKYPHSAALSTLLANKPTISTLTRHASNDTTNPPNSLADLDLNHPVVQRMLNTSHVTRDSSSVPAARFQRPSPHRAISETVSASALIGITRSPALQPASNVPHHVPRGVQRMVRDRSHTDNLAQLDLRNDRYSAVTRGPRSLAMPSELISDVQGKRHHPHVLYNAREAQSTQLLEQTKTPSSRPGRSLTDSAITSRESISRVLFITNPTPTSQYEDSSAPPDEESARTHAADAAPVSSPPQGRDEEVDVIVEYMVSNGCATSNLEVQEKAVHCLSIPLKVKNSGTAIYLKRRLHEITGIPPQLQLLIFETTILEGPDFPLGDLQLKQGAVFYLYKRV